MAALLKKRALAEYSQTIQEEPSRRPLKKLCLTKKSETAKAQQVSDNLKSGDGGWRMSTLIQLEQNIPTDGDEKSLLHRILVDHYAREQESAIRTKIASLLPQLSPARLDELASFVATESSHLVLAALMDAIVLVGEHAIANEDKAKQLKCLSLVEKSLKDTSHIVKCRVLTMLARLVPSTPAEPLDSVVATLTSHTRHQDPRVRTAALQATLVLHQRDIPLDVSLYSEACRGLNDDFENVRMASMKLVHAMASSHAKKPVEVEKGAGERIPMYDHSFAKICQMVSDGSMNVRILSANILGQMLHVSPNFLEQTLDKKLMSNLRKKASAHERQREAFTAGEWSSGQKWQDDAPRERLEENNVSLMNQGACGFFVHALEDEFLEVRMASLDALCNLAVRFAEFASQSLDFVVDMFNDEIEEVRLRAIDCLAKMGHAHVLRDDQLDTVLCVLKDYSMYTREALHHMLCCCRIKTQTSLNACVEALLENLRRYPQDKKSIYRCFMKLGQSNPYITLSLVTKLLNIHPYLDLPEPDIEDQHYIAILILVFNAAAGCPTMLPLLEEHTLRHYIYLRDSLPHLVPYLELPSKNGQLLSVAQSNTSSSVEQSEAFLHQVLLRVTNPPGSSYDVRQRWLKAAILDLQKLADMEPALAAGADCARIYISCQSMITKIVTNRSWLDLSQSTQPMGFALKSMLDELFKQAYILEHRFIGLTPPEVASVRQLWLRLRALHLVLVIRGSNTSALGLCEAFLLQVDRLHSFLEEHKLDPDSWTSAVLRELDTLSDTRPGSVCRAVAPLLSQLATPNTLVLRDTRQNLQRIKQANVIINEPSGEQDLAIKFMAGLLVPVTLDCELENIDDVTLVRVRLRYPDKQEQLIIPRRSDFRTMDDGRQRLYTKVLLSHGVWSEALHVQLSVVLNFQGLNPSDENYIELCKPVRVYISPKPIKKGI